MDTNKLRKNLTLHFNGINSKTNYNSYKYSMSYNESEDIPKSYDISDNRISLAFDNYTKNSDTELYVNSYRPDSPDKFMINPENPLVELDDLFISDSAPNTISNWTSIDFRIIATETENIDDKIRIIPHIDGVSINSTSNIFEIPNHK